MKTLENTAEFVYSEKELNKLMKDFLKQAETFIYQNNYDISDNDANLFEKYKKLDWVNLFQYNTSKRRKKRFNKYVNRFEKMKSIKSLNLLFHFIHKRILSTYDKTIEKGSWGVCSQWKWVPIEGFDTSIKIKPPVKHQKIQEARKNWKEAQKIADELHQKYKEEKGDYYKLLLKENVKI